MAGITVRKRVRLRAVVSIILGGVAGVAVAFVLGPAPGLLAG